MRHPTQNAAERPLLKAVSVDVHDAILVQPNWRRFFNDRKRFLSFACESGGHDEGITPLEKAAAMTELAGHSSHVFAQLRGMLAAADKGRAARPTLHDLDMAYHTHCTANALYPGVLGYTDFPKASCMSVNDVVAHGLPLSSRKVLPGDLLKLDIVFCKDPLPNGAGHQVIGGRPPGVFLDIADTYVIDPARCSGTARKLVSCTRDALEMAMDRCRVGTPITEPARVYKKVAMDNGFSVAHGLNSHFIGRCLHAGLVPNTVVREPVGAPASAVGKFSSSSQVISTFEEGMTFTLEPLFVASRGTDGISAPLLPCQNGFAYRTADGAPSAHFERTLIMTRSGCKSFHSDLA